ncbi:MAG TPA: hypothetical protein VKU40_11505 [Thermoanaerobaculia bacterium]|nr:hypothetical protein [Thermoanaerobaculia bacterium]
MRLQTKIAVVVGALALTASPAAPTMADHHEGEPHGKGKGQDQGKGHDATPGPKAGLPAKAKAYGRYCKGESRKGEKGQKGTDFSRCVTNMAQAANRKAMAPGRVCKGESKQHEKGEKGTEFSRCVRDVAQLRRQERREA